VSEERYNEFLAEHDPKKGTMAHTWFVDGSSDANALVEKCEKTFKGKGPRFTTTTNPGSLSSVNLLSNGIGIDQAKALASILKGHPTLKSLCGNKGDETVLDMSGKMKKGAEEDAIMLAPEIADNGAISHFTFSGGGDCFGHDRKPVIMETSMVEADFSWKVLGVSGAIMLGAFLPKCT
jgi:hypothetical protein